MVSTSSREFVELQTRCYLFVGRLRVFQELFCESLKAEGRDTLESLAAWVDNTRLLVMAGVAIECAMLGDRSEASAIFFSRNAGFLLHFEQTIALSLDVLTRSGPWSAASIHQALHVKCLSFHSSIQAGLLAWQRRLQPASQDAIISIIGFATTDPEIESVASEEIQRARSLVRIASIHGDAVENCLALRTLFLSMYFVAVMHPSAWTQEMFDQIVALHLDALEHLEDKVLRASVHRSLSIMHEFGIDVFTRRVANIAV